MGHDPQLGNKPLGRPSLLREDGDGAFYEVPLYPSVPDLIVDGLRGGAYGASFRFSVAHEELVQRPGVSAHNPEGIPERTVKEANVAEFSPVTFPAYEGATASLRSLAEEIGCECRDGARAPAAVLAMLKGTRMVTPVRQLDGLRPGLSRLVVDHELVRGRAHLFRPADPADSETRSRLRAKHATRAGNGKPLNLPGRAFKLPRRERELNLPARTRHGRILP